MLYSFLSDICLKLREVNFLLLCIFFFLERGGGHHGMIFIMFNSEKSRDNSLCPIHFSMLDTQIKIQNGPDFVSPFICLTLCNYILDHCWHAGTGLWSNGHQAYYRCTFYQLDMFKYNNYKITHSVKL